MRSFTKNAKGPFRQLKTLSYILFSYSCQSGYFNSAVTFPETTKPLTILSVQMRPLWTKAADPLKPETGQNRDRRWKLWIISWKKKVSNSAVLDNFIRFMERCRKYKKSNCFNIKYLFLINWFNMFRGFHICWSANFQCLTKRISPCQSIFDIVQQLQAQKKCQTFNKSIDKSSIYFSGHMKSYYISNW